MKLIKIIFIIFFCGSCIKKEVPVKSVDFSQEDCVLGEGLKLLSGNVKFKNVKYCSSVAFSLREAPYEIGYGVGIKKCKENKHLNIDKMYLVGKKGLVLLDSKTELEGYVYFKEKVTRRDLRDILDVNFTFLAKDSRKNYESFFFDRLLFLNKEVKLLPKVENFSVEFNRVESEKMEEFSPVKGCYFGKSKRFHYHYCFQDKKLKIYKGDRYIGETEVLSMSHFFEMPPFEYENTWYFPLRFDKEGVLLLFKRSEEWYLTSLKPICRESGRDDTYPRI